MSETSETQDEQEDGGRDALPSWVPGDIEAEGGGEADGDAQVAAAEDDGEGADALDAAADMDEAAMDEPDMDDDPAMDAAGADDGADGAAAVPAAAADGGPMTVALPSRLRTPEAEELAETLREAASASELVFDAREVDDIGAAAVACIVSTLRAREDFSPPAAILSPSPAFVDAFSDLGLFQDLMKMEFRQ